MPEWILAEKFFIHSFLQMKNRLIELTGSRVWFILFFLFLEL